MVTARPTESFEDELIYGLKKLPYLAIGVFSSDICGYHLDGRNNSACTCGISLRSRLVFHHPSPNSELETSLSSGVEP